MILFQHKESTVTFRKCSLSIYFRNYWIFGYMVQSWYQCISDKPGKNTLVKYIYCFLRTKSCYLYSIRQIIIYISKEISSLTLNFGTFYVRTQFKLILVSFLLFFFTFSGPNCPNNKYIFQKTHPLSPLIKYFCQICQIVIHENCASKLTRKCPSLLNDIYFYEKFNSKPQSPMNSMILGMSCYECGSRVDSFVRDVGFLLFVISICQYSRLFLNIKPNSIYLISCFYVILWRARVICFE